MINAHSQSPFKLPTFPDVRASTAIKLGTVVTTSTGSANYKRIVLTRSPVAPVWADTTAPVVMTCMHDLRELKVTYGQLPIDPAIGYSPNTAYPTGTPGQPTITMLGTTGPNVFVTPMAVKDKTSGNATYLPLFPSATSGSPSYVSYIFGKSGNLAFDWGAKIRLVVEFLVRSGETVEYDLGVSAGGTTAYAQAAFLISQDNWPTGAIGVRAKALSMDIVETLYYLWGVSGNATAAFTPQAATANGILTLTDWKRVLAPLTKPVSIEQSVLPYQNSRLTALGLRVQNTTKVMDKEGVMQVLRLDGRTHSFVNPDVTTLYDSVPLRDRWTGSLADTIYVALPFASKMLEFEDHLIMLDARYPSELTPLLQVANLDYFVVLQAYDPSTASPTNLLLDAAWHLEFRHTGILWPLSVCGMTLEAYHKLAIRSAQVPPCRQVRKGETLLTSKGSPPAIADRRKKATGPLYKVRHTDNRGADYVERRNGRVTYYYGGRPQQGLAPPKPKPAAPRQKMRGGLDMYLAAQKAKPTKK